MIFSESWLREWVNPGVDTRQLTELLTMAGLEVDGIEPVARKFSGIVVGLVESVEKHPDADKLNVCQVTDGKQSYQVVCGAPNVRAGLKVPFAQVGAEIISDDNEPVFKIKAAKLRGVESNGMLCSAEELGMSESSAGLLELDAAADVGMDVRQCLQLDDSSIELDLTPNRGDCLGVMGLAREVGVLTRTDVSYPDKIAIQEEISDEFVVKISAPDACPRYLGRVIRGVNLDAETPAWMCEKLRRCGLRSIDPIVDVTNFVLIELGQPMHAFDLSKLNQHIDVRFAADNEVLTLLDGKEVTLSADTLVIADAEKAVAIAGVMGGMDTAVSDSTVDVFLECAFFAPLAVAGKARSYGMHTDASHRYERGVDFQLQHRAMQRATQLLLDIAGGQAGPITEALGNIPDTATVELHFASIKRLLGIDIPETDVRDILQRLGLKFLQESGKSVLLEIPSYRFDLSIEADLIEEVARVYGYNKLPKTPGMMTQVLKSSPEATLNPARLKHHLVALGYQEVITYSFIDPAISTKVCGDSSTAIALTNPISAEMSIMRGSILPGLLGALKHNENRQQDRMRLFESGLVFTRQGEQIVQTAHLAGLVYGRNYPNNWINNKEIVSFYDVKGDVESLLSLGRRTDSFEFVPAQHSTFHPGQCAAVMANGALVGYVGALHPSIQRELGIDRATYLFELSLQVLLEARVPRASELSKYPEVHRDLAIVVDETITSDKIQGLIRDNAGEYLTDLRIFDVYQGDAVAKNKKSIALGLTWQHPSRTLSDDEINTIISSCVNALQDKFNADLRN